MEIKPTRKGTKAWIVLQILIGSNCSSVCVKDIAEAADTTATSTTISQLRAKGWIIVNERHDFICHESGKRVTSSRYTLHTSINSEQTEFTFTS